MGRKVKSTGSMLQKVAPGNKRGLYALSFNTLATHFHVHCYKGRCDPETCTRRSETNDERKVK